MRKHQPCLLPFECCVAEVKVFGKKNTEISATRVGKEEGGELICCDHCHDTSHVACAPRGSCIPTVAWTCARCEEEAIDKNKHVIGTPWYGTTEQNLNRLSPKQGAITSKDTPTEAWYTTLVPTAGSWGTTQSKANSRKLHEDGGSNWKKTTPLRASQQHAWKPWDYYAWQKRPVKQSGQRE